MKKSLFGRLIIDGILHYVQTITYSNGKTVKRIYDGQKNLVKVEKL
jgi:hypothetical protein